MTNVVQSALLSKILKFGLTRVNSNLKFSTRSNQILSPQKEAQISNLCQQCKNSNIRHLSSTKIYFKDKVESNQGDQEKEQDNAENSDYDKGESGKFSSSYHQQYRRQAYEHKRSTFHQKIGGGTQNHDSKKTETSSSNLDLSNQMNHYQRLNIEQDADQNAIKTAYYSLSKIYHPDVIATNDVGAAENFRLITESYDVLSNSATRLDYDRELGLKKSANHESFRSWSKPSHTTNRDYGTILRTRNADSIYRFRQDAALEREKLKNPRKFQAGSFGSPEEHESDFHYTDHKIQSFKKRLNSLQNAKSSSTDGTDFYHQHLYDSIQRRHKDLVNSRESYMTRTGYSNYSSGPNEPFSFFTIIGLLLAAFLVLLNLILDMDIAAYLDDQIQQKKLVKEKEDT